MSRITAAKKSAILLLAALFILLAVSFFPSGDDGGKVALREKSTLFQQLQELNSLPPAVDVKIEPAVKDTIKNALVLALSESSF